MTQGHLIFAYENLSFIVETDPDVLLVRSIIGLQYYEALLLFAWNQNVNQIKNGPYLKAHFFGGGISKI